MAREDKLKDKAWLLGSGEQAYQGCRWSTRCRKGGE